MFGFIFMWRNVSLVLNWTYPSHNLFVKRFQINSKQCITCLTLPFISVPQVKSYFLIRLFKLFNFSSLFYWVAYTIKALLYYVKQMDSKILKNYDLNLKQSHDVNLFDFRKGRWFGSGEPSICRLDCRWNITSLQGNCYHFHCVLPSHWHWLISGPFGPKSNSNWQLPYNSHRIQCSQQSKINCNTILTVVQGIL